VKSNDGKKEVVAKAVAGSSGQNDRTDVGQALESIQQELYMTSKNTAVFGIYNNSAQAESAVDQIVESRTVAGGFTHNDISVLLHDTKSSKEFAHEKNTKAPEGKTTGVTTGGVVGGAGGGLISELVGMGIPEYEAQRYEGRVKDGGVLLSVHCDTSDEISRAKDLLEQTGAEDISSAGERVVSSHDVLTGTVSKMFRIFLKNRLKQHTC
jgi:Heat induced stress protein YflT